MLVLRAEFPQIPAVETGCQRTHILATHEYLFVVVGYSSKIV